MLMVGYYPKNQALQHADTNKILWHQPSIVFSDGKDEIIGPSGFRRSVCCPALQHSLTPPARPEIVPVPFIMVARPAAFYICLLVFEVNYFSEDNGYWYVDIVDCGAQDFRVYRKIVKLPMTDPAGVGRKMLTLFGGISWWDPWHTIFLAAPWILGQKSDELHRRFDLCCELDLKEAAWHGRCYCRTCNSEAARMVGSKLKTRNCLWSLSHDGSMVLLYMGNTGKLW